MISNIKYKFPNDMLNTYETLKSLRDSKDEWRYLFMEDSEFTKIQDIEITANIYWSEMLYRIHIIALISSFKTLRWIEAIDNNYNNYYGFCSSLRGLIESVADTFYTLKNIPLTIATDFKVIKEQINKKSHVITIHEKLESELLHYIQATKLDQKQKENSPKSFNAKQIREYINSINDTNDRISNLYDYLCGIAHPAFESNQLFLFLHDNNTIVCNDSLNFESKLIEGLLDAHSDTLAKLFRVYMNNILSVLLIVNEFDIEQLHTSISFEAEFKENNIWKDILEYINESEEKYEEALKSGKYI